MKLDRNLNPDGKGKYALILQRKLSVPIPCNSAGMAVLPVEVIDFGDTPDTEVFVIRLKDKYAAAALHAYADAAKHDDPEWSGQVRTLAFTAAHHPNKQPPT